MSLPCVMGVLRTEAGIHIKKRISQYLEPRFKVFYVEQDPPGVMFEYPALLYTLNMAIDLNAPVLYIHTKGAANPNNSWYQTPVKKLWAFEFGTDKVLSTYKRAMCNNPTVICPIAGPHKQTWWNGMIINPAAAQEIIPTFKFIPNRYYYEAGFCNHPNIQVISSAVNGTYNEHDTNVLLRKLTEHLPDIDY